MRICIAGDPQDLSSVYISWLAQRQGFEVVDLSESTLGTDWAFAYSDSDLSAGYIEKSDRRYPLTSFLGVFVRLHPQPGLPDGIVLSPAEASAFVVERRHAIQHLLNSFPCVVANRPYSGRANGSKPHQMNLLTKAGFSVPSWIASNEKSVVENFSRSCRGGVIYKSCSGIRSKVRLLDDELLRRLQEGTSPVVVQEYIKGHDVRVHVVRNHVFATKVISHSVDYRFESGNNEFRETSIPDHIQMMCRDFALADHLTIAGFDFRVTKDEKWYCLEVNPVPTFLPYEMETGQAIGNALLNVFCETHADSRLWPM
ncbi:MAG: ATP-grasp domain-containing protein [Caldilineaceae bacterium]|nr:ATP-grasp domain-containing protein [Caldilineaceae bacterium]